MRAWSHNSWASWWIGDSFYWRAAISQSIVFSLYFFTFSRNWRHSCTSYCYSITPTYFKESPFFVKYFSFNSFSIWLTEIIDLFSDSGNFLRFTCWCNSLKCSALWNIKMFIYSSSSWSSWLILMIFCLEDLLTANLQVFD